MRLLATLTLALAAASCWADSPPSWMPFQATSEDGKFVASVFAADANVFTVEPWNRRYRLRVSEAGAKQRVLWETEYKFDGYHGGQPSNDGQYFAYVNFWYYDDYPVVTVYWKDGSAKFTGKELGIDSSSLQPTASHQLWLDGASGFLPLTGNPTCIIINTVQGIRYIKLRPAPSVEARPNGIEPDPRGAPC